MPRAGALSKYEPLRRYLAGRPAETTHITLPVVDVAAYEPLRRYLAGLPPAVETVTLTVGEIEAVLGTPLPLTARLRHWWGGRRPGAAQAWAWHTAGWRVTALAMQHGVAAVTFTRVEAAAEGSPAAR